MQIWLLHIRDVNLSFHQKYYEYFLLDEDMVTVEDLLLTQGTNLSV